MSEEDHINETELGNEKNSTVVGILDMDAFEVQIYLNDRFGVKEGRKTYETKPVILVDSTTERIISVNYKAKEFKISREDTLGSAQDKCPNLMFIRKDKNPRSNKPKGAKLRHSSWKVLDSIKKIREREKLKMILEYASNDEFYFDLTEEVNYRLKNKSRNPITLEKLGNNTHLEGISSKHKGRSIIYRAQWIYGMDVPKYWQESRLIYGAVILEEIRRFIFSDTHFEASGGVSCNKLLAKLACPLHKPGGMTILPETGLQRVAKRIPIEKLPTLGGPRGQTLKNCFKNGGIMYMSELAAVPLFKIKEVTNFGHPVAVNIWKLANGISYEKVEEKLMKESVTVGQSNLRERKLFFNNVIGVEDVLAELLEEMIERLGEEKARHKRVAEGIRFAFHCFAKGHKGGKKPAERGFTTLFELDDPDHVDFQGILDSAMMEYRQMIITNMEGINGMIVKINLVVKTFLDLPQS